MRVVLLADLGEQFEVCPTVFVAVLHSDLREYTWHRLGSNSTINRTDSAETTITSPFIIVGFGFATGTKKSGTCKFLDANREAHVDLTSLDRHDDGTKSSGASCARVRH